AQPMGRPGWPEFAFSTASMASARTALAMSFSTAELVMKSRSSGSVRMAAGASPRRQAGLTGSVDLSMSRGCPHSVAMADELWAIVQLGVGRFVEGPPSDRQHLRRGV